MVGGGVSVAFQGLLKLLKIVFCHCHLPLHQQNVLDKREGAGMRKRKQEPHSEKQDARYRTEIEEEI